jgi:hypothetical protein
MIPYGRIWLEKRDTPQVAYLLQKLSRLDCVCLDVSPYHTIILIASLEGCDYREQYHAIGSPKVHEYARFGLGGIGTGTTSILMTIGQSTI